MTKLILPALLAMLLLMPRAQGAAATATGTITGTVVDSADKPLANVKVRFRKVAAPGAGKLAATTAPAGAVATTDKDGKFSQTLDPGDYWAEAGSKTLGYDKQRCGVKAGETADLKLTLTKDEPPK